MQGGVSAPPISNARIRISVLAGENLMVFEVNGRRHDLDVSPDMPLLWVLRDNLGLTGTKFGCGLGQCGACTVHVDGDAVRSCMTPASRRRRQEDHDHRGAVADLNPSAADGVGCRAGAAVRLLPVGPDHVGGGAAREDAEARPTREIDTAMAGNICRCGTYQRIRRAIHRAAHAQGRPSMARHRTSQPRALPEGERRRRRRAHRSAASGFRSSATAARAQAPRASSSRTSGSGSTPTTA